MKPLSKAEQRAILQVENNYVFNSIYFGEVGLTSASASHVSAMANVLANDIKERLKGLRLYRKYIRVIGEDECLVEERNDTLGNIENDLDMISKANALIAWLREAIKEREAGIDHVNETSLRTFCALKGIELPEMPEEPVMPRVNFGDIRAIIGDGFTIKEYNRLMELNSTLAVYGEIIHEKGLLTAQKKKLQDIAKNPMDVQAGGRDTIITRYEADSVESIDDAYTRLQAKYRKLQAEKNGIEAKWAELAMRYQTDLKSKFDEERLAYERLVNAYDAAKERANSEMIDWKKAECERIAALKIVIPNDLADIYAELKAKYL